MNASKKLELYKKLRIDGICKIKDCINPIAHYEKYPDNKLCLDHNREWGLEQLDDFIARKNNL